MAGVISYNNSSTKPVQTNATVLRRFLPGVNRQRQRKPGRCVRLHIPLVEKTELKSQRFHHKCAHKRRVVSMHDGRFVQRQSAIITIHTITARAVPAAVMKWVFQDGYTWEQALIMNKLDRHTKLTYNWPRYIVSQRPLDRGWPLQHLGH